MNSSGFFDKVKEYLSAIKVGFFLARREIRFANRWSTLLIISIMTLTFLNLIVVRGILVGLVEGVRRANREHINGDIQLSALDENDTIENSSQVLGLIQNLDEVKAASGRYVTSGKLEANYRTQIKQNENSNTVSGFLYGINPELEDRANELKSFIFQGEYLTQNDLDHILIGTDLISDYSLEGDGLDNIVPGAKVRLTVNKITREVTVKGIIKSKVEEISNGIYLTDSQLRQLLGRSDYGLDEISIRLENGYQPEQIKRVLIANGLDKYAEVETWQEAEPAFVKDITNTFALLSNIISSISLVVASITTFIIIFVNAITQRQLIGIMKGIGIHWFAIVSSYMIQAWFYAFSGTIVAVAIIYGFLEPYIAENPINFPFSDGVLLVSPTNTASRAALLLIATLIAGYVPAKMIVNKNTLDSILGR